MDQPIVSIRNVSKRFANVTAVDGVSLDIRRNEFFALLGPSGCGKTTLLRMIAGLETASGGEIIIDGRNMADAPPNTRPVNMVFQSYAVFPHMTVAANVGYGLMVTGVKRGEIANRVREALAMVRLDGLEQRMPDQLSGGQRQRVALARALVKRPKVLLLDEPLSALDAKLREQMRLELTRLQHSVGITFIIVTHDQDEALSMADRVAVMDGGKVCQVDGPAALYEQPKSRFVAGFIGKVNLIEAHVIDASDGMVSLEAGGVGKLRVPHDGKISGQVTIAVRPEKLKISTRPPVGENLVKTAGAIHDIAYYGDASYVFVTTECGTQLSVNVQNHTRDDKDLARGDKVWLSWYCHDTLILEE